MKKLIFLLLLAQTISFLYGDAACMGYRHYQGHEGQISDPADTNAWRWGVKSMYKVRCDCPCMKYKQLANHKCQMCGHTRVPEDLKLTGASDLDQTPTTITITTIPHKKTTHQQRKAQHKAQKAAKAKKKKAKRDKKHTHCTSCQHEKLIAVTDE